MSARAEIRPALDRLIAALRERRLPTDPATLRVLRDFGLECREIGIHHAHTTRTIPAAPVLGHDDVTGQYLLLPDREDDPP